jgi:hypothetical protein
MQSTAPGPEWGTAPGACHLGNVSDCRRSRGRDPTEHAQDGPWRGPKWRSWGSLFSPECARPEGSNRIVVGTSETAAALPSEIWQSGSNVSIAASGGAKNRDKHSDSKVSLASGHEATRPLDYVTNSRRAGMMTGRNRLRPCP